MAGNPDRDYDKTSLEVTNFMGIHRDYAAHFFRWGFVNRVLVDHSTRILDIGCGVDQPLAKVISATNDFKKIPGDYLGVDLNKEPAKVFRAKWASFIYGFNFPDNWPKLLKIYGSYDLITCFEVVEHMRPASVKKLLNGARAMLRPGGTFVLSTPVANGRPAKNHINEMDVPTLAKMLAAAGFEVSARYGTFMSDQDRKKCATPEESALCERLKRFYAGDVVACFLAPLYPDSSRNNVWLCKSSADTIVEDLL